VSATEARFAVLQVRYVLEGLVAAMPGWDDADAGDQGDDHDMSENEEQGIESDDGFPGEEVYSSGTYELPMPTLDTSRLDFGGGEEANDLRPACIVVVVRELVSIALKQHSQDSKMLKALAKCVDVCMNGVDILQKHSRRLRLRYTIMKARNREVAVDGYTKLLPRYMVVVKLHHHYLSRVMIRLRKMNSLPIIASMLDGVNALSVNEHSGVRSRGQLALLSYCRRYRGSCSFTLPKLITILEDKDIEEPGHEQRICGACVLLQTRYFQGRILRDWRMIEYFLITLCSSYHNDKDTVLDALDGLFATFLSYWYQISLDCPGYMAWKGGRGKWESAQVPFQNYGRMLEVLVKLLKTAPHMHWRFKLMIIDAVTVMIRDDVQSPMAVWECILDGMVSENSHIREACVPALGSALELMQDSQQSKQDVDGLQARFPDKAFHHWNGAPRKARLSKNVFDARKRTADPEYKAAVRKVVMGYFTDAQYLDKFINVMSVVQLGRSKHMNGSHAQLFKGLLKAFGPTVVASLEPRLDTMLADPQAHSRLSSDVYIGQQCFVAELVAGLVRGSKYWIEEDKATMRTNVSKILRHMLSVPEMETVGVWAMCLRFCIFDRHPRHTSWLTEIVMDNAIPPKGEMGTTSVLVCKRLLLLKTIIKELAWRGGPLQRQLAHDIEPFLSHPYAQMRTCVGSIMASIARVSWDPAFDGRPLPGDAPPAIEGKHVLVQGAEGDNAGDKGAAIAAPRFSFLVPPRNKPVFCVQEVGHVEGGREREGGVGVAARKMRPIFGSEPMYRLVQMFTKEWVQLSALIKLQKAEASSATLGTGAGGEGGGGGGEGGGGVDDAEKEKASKAAMTNRDTLRHLRHTLITMICSVCPEFDAMYRCPLESYLPVLLPPLLAALEDRDPDISRQARGCAELTANTPLLTEVCV
jgi:hypothetical protein